MVKETSICHVSFRLKSRNRPIPIQERESAYHQRARIAKRFRRGVVLNVISHGRIRCFRRNLWSSDCAGLNGAERRSLETVLIHKTPAGLVPV